jgi:hypothetical protein
MTAACADPITSFHDYVLGVDPMPLHGNPLNSFAPSQHILGDVFYRVETIRVLRLSDIQMNIVSHICSRFVIRSVGDGIGVVRRWSDFTLPASLRPCFIHFLKFFNQILRENTNGNVCLLQLNMSENRFVFVPQALHDSRSFGVDKAIGTRCFVRFSYGARFQRCIDGAASQVDFVRIIAQLFESAKFGVISALP